MTTITPAPGESPSGCTCRPEDHEIDPILEAGLSKADWHKLTPGLCLCHVPNAHRCIYQYLQCFETSGALYFPKKVRAGLKVANAENGYRVDGHPFVRPEDAPWANFLYGDGPFTDEDAENFRQVALRVGAPDNAEDYVHVCHNLGAEKQFTYRRHRLPPSVLTLERVKYIRLGLDMGGLYVNLALAPLFLNYAVSCIVGLEEMRSRPDPIGTVAHAMKYIYENTDNADPSIAAQAYFAQPELQSGLRKTYKDIGLCIAAFEKLWEQIQEDAEKGVVPEGQSDAHTKLAAILLTKGFESFKKESLLGLWEDYKKEIDYLIVKTDEEKQVAAAAEAVVAKKIKLADLKAGLVQALLGGPEKLHLVLGMYGISGEVAEGLHRELVMYASWGDEAMVEAAERYGLEVIDKDGLEDSQQSTSA